MEDMRAVETLQRTTRLSDGRYETDLLWRNEDVRLPNHRCEAERRTQGEKRCFRNSEKLRKPEVQNSVAFPQDGLDGKRVR